MKAAVFSDTHTNTALMMDAIRRTRPDMVIHLGDHERDVDAIRFDFPEIVLYNVAGNCDYDPSSPLEDVIPMGPVKAYITHGHMHNVKWGDYSRIAYAAMEKGCSLALFGHTHEAYYEDFGSVKVLNPGTAGRSRTPTYALVEVFDNGSIACEIKDL